VDPIKALGLVMIVTTTLGAGLQIRISSLKAVLSNYGLLGKALLANFVLLPAFALLLTRVFSVQSDVAVGILLMAMAPGVPFLVNSAARKQGGSLAFALAIAFVFSALSIVTIPITAELLLPAGALATVPVKNFLVTLVLFQLVPLIVGALLSTRLSAQVIEKTVKVLHLAFAAAALVFIVMLFPKVVAAVGAVQGFGQLAIIAAIGVFAAGIGWLCGGPDREYRRTLSIATLLRNIGLCTLIGNDSFADTLVLPTIIAYFVVTFALSIPIRLYYQKNLPTTAPT
jgi:bile acid:Na+ symporter, BASS family